MQPYKFSIKLRGFEPMSGSKGKGKRLEKKRELVDRIARKAGDEIGVAHAALDQKCLHVWDGLTGCYV